MMLTDQQIDEIVEKAAEKAADRALEKIYAEVGKNVLRKLAWLIGLVVVSLAIWLAGKNSLKL